MYVKFTFGTWTSSCLTGGLWQVPLYKHCIAPFIPCFWRDKSFSKVCAIPPSLSATMCATSYSTAFLYWILAMWHRRLSFLKQTHGVSHQTVLLSYLDLELSGLQILHNIPLTSLPLRTESSHGNSVSQVDLYLTACFDKLTMTMCRACNA